MTISVVYLAYLNEKAGYGIDTVEQFLASYKTYDAGIEHSLVIIAKNWTDNILYEKLCNLAKAHNAKVIDLPDDGWDFGAYFRVSKILDSEYVLFTASSTKILSDNWLLNFYNVFKNDNKVQLVGPMGSWGYRLDVKNFPNPHIRTCTFMIKRELFLEYASTQKFPQTKEDTHEMEHGETSITNFVLNKGYKAVVVNSDGEIFMPDNWVYSKTYNTPDDNKSFFSDKRSAKYYTDSEKDKRHMEMATWGQYLIPSKVKIFVSYQQITPIFISEVLQPIFIGANTNPNRVNALKDNTGINISEKNASYEDLTGHYWVWKNYLPKTQAEYIGFSQYCSFLDFNLNLSDNALFQSTFILDFENMVKTYTEENVLNKIKNHDVILPEKFSLYKTLYEDYLSQHPQRDIDLVLKILGENYPKYLESAQKTLMSDTMYSCMVFVMKKELFSEYMEWLFNILTTLEKTTNGAILNDKTPACIAEVLFNIWLIHNIETRKLRTLNTSSVYVPMDF